MPAITISREIGSKGDIIAEQAADRLGYRLVDKKFIEKIFYEFGYIDFKEVYDETGFWARFDRHHTEMLHLLNRVFEALVFHGDVILLGRGGFAALKGFSDVLNVRIQAPFDARVQRIMEKQGLASLAQAEDFVRDSDRMRKGFVESIYGQKWDSALAFDLVIDTGKIAPEMAVNWLVQEAAHLALLPTGNVHTTRSLQVDPVLANAIDEMLNKQAIYD